MAKIALIPGHGSNNGTFDPGAVNEKLKIREERIEELKKKIIKIIVTEYHY